MWCMMMCVKKFAYFLLLVALVLSSVQSFANDALFVGPKEPETTIYQRPYSLDENIVDKHRLYRNTEALFAAGVGTMAFLYVMPSSFTHWDDEDNSNPFKKWWKNVSHAPVWDKDDIFLNYVTHPYAGAIYYMGARSVGANATNSFLYSFLLSTFFWEYGLEAFAERPSIQDLIVTPVFGALLGEGFYKAKRHILENDKQLYGSRFLGVTTLFLIDPITEVSDLIWDDADKASHFNLRIQSQPIFSHKGVGYGVHASFSF